MTLPWHLSIEEEKIYHVASYVGRIQQRVEFHLEKSFKGSNPGVELKYMGALKIGILLQGARSCTALRAE